MRASIVLYLLGAALAYGQPTPSQLVNLNVVALDNHNQPVADLMPDDFQVMDDGQPQRLVFFRHNDTSRRAAARGPGEFTNRPDGQPQHATAILFDFLNDSMGASGGAMKQLVSA